MNMDKRITHGTYIATELRIETKLSAPVSYRASLHMSPDKTPRLAYQIWYRDIYDRMRTIKL